MLGVSNRALDVTDAWAESMLLSSIALDYAHPWPQRRHPPTSFLVPNALLLALRTWRNDPSSPSYAAWTVLARTQGEPVTSNVDETKALLTLLISALVANRDAVKVDPAHQSDGSVIFRVW